MEAFIGEIRLFGGAYVPEGWAACNGQLLSISDNDTLYSLIGTTYGGDGMSTFGLPNLSGRVAVGSGQGSGLSAYQPGQVGGFETVTLQATQLPSHSHTATATLQVSTGVGTSKVPDNNMLATSGQSIYAAQPGTAGTMAANSVTAASSAAGSNGGHENRQPSLAITYIIALQGIYPSAG
jgi:microcystin-dependent protein